MAQPKLATSNQFKIDRDVPVPPSGSGTQKYPFPQMEIGDSFVGPEAARTASHNWGKVNGKKFRVRAEGASTVRVWRIA